MSHQKAPKISIRQIAKLILAGLLGGGGLAGLIAMLLQVQSAWRQSDKDEAEKRGVSSFPVAFYSKLAEVPNVPKMRVNYGGSTSLAKLRDPKIVDLIQKSQPEFKLDYKDPPSGKPGSESGIRMLLDKQLTFAMSSRSLLPNDHEEARKRNFVLEEHPIANDGVAFYVNPGLSLSPYPSAPSAPIPGLARATLKSILVGDIVNWKELGGPDLPIVIYSRDPKDGGTPNFVIKEVMDGQPFAKSVVIERDTTTSVQDVAKTPGAIGYATVPQVCDQSNLVQSLPIFIEKKGDYVSPCLKGERKVNRAVFENGEYPLTRKLFIIIRRDKTVEEKAGVAYVNLLSSIEGQRLVEQVGFLPIIPLPPLPLGK